MRVIGNFRAARSKRGESVEQALARELHEELGITVKAVTRWKTEMVDYPHALVRLHFCKVFDWRGELQMREGQRCGLAAAAGRRWRRCWSGRCRCCDWLAEERGFVGAALID